MNDRLTRAGSEIVQPSPADREARLEEVIASYVEAVQAGQPPGQDTILAAHPELAEPLREFFANQDRMKPLSRSVSAGDSPSATAESNPDLSAAPTVSFLLENGGCHECRKSGTAGLRRVGDYELLSEVGRGGMGIVYRARQISLDRTVAVKTIRSGGIATDEDVARFQAEAESAAKLDHPHIVKIYGVWEHEAQHYFSMEYVEGKSLAELIRDGPLAPRRAARYLQQVAKAIAYAHENGVVHRDIKPSNVLIDSLDQARVMDFGLAKRVEADNRLTMSGQLLGTPPYMSPEQVAETPDPTGPASDIFSLGGLFYALLTGQPPFQGSTTLDILLAVRDSDPRHPQRLNPRVPRELALICLKCLEKDPARRYASARDLAGDVGRFLDGSAISIGSMSLVERLSRQFERSCHDIELATWGDMTLCVAAIVVVTHFLVFWIAWALPGHLTLGHAAIRGLEFAGIGLVMATYGRQWYPPRSLPGRQCWTIWFSYLAGSVVLALTGYLTARSGRTFHELDLYPQFAVLASVGFFIMGSSYWGYCYLFGAGFLILGLLMPLAPLASPIAFGIYFGLCFWVMGRHLRTLARGA